MNETSEGENQAGLAERQGFLSKTPALAEKVVALLQQPDWVQKGENIRSRPKWQEELAEVLAANAEEKEGKKGVAVGVIDLCGESCGRKDRQFPEAIREVWEKLEEALQNEKAKGEITWGRRQLEFNHKHRAWEVGEDEVWVWLNRIDEKKVAAIGARLDEELNGAGQRAYIALASVRRGAAATASQILRAADIALGAAKERWKERNERALAIARFGGGQWQLNAGAGWQEISAAAMALKPAEYPEKVIVANAAQQLRSRWQDQSWQQGYALVGVASPAGMKRINKEWGMTSGDQALQAIAKALVAITERDNLKIGEIGIYKIGVNFVVTGPRALADDIQEAIEQKLAALPRENFPFGIQYAFFGEELAK